MNYKCTKRRILKTVPTNRVQFRSLFSTQCETITMTTATRFPVRQQRHNDASADIRRQWFRVFNVYSATSRNHVFYSDVRTRIEGGSFALILRNNEKVDFCQIFLPIPVCFCLFITFFMQRQHSWGYLRLNNSIFIPFKSLPRQPASLHSSAPLFFTQFTQHLQVSNPFTQRKYTQEAKLMYAALFPYLFEKNHVSIIHETNKLITKIYFFTCKTFCWDDKPLNFDVI